jgi:hypothetical protein
MKKIMIIGILEYTEKDENLFKETVTETVTNVEREMNSYYKMHKECQIY